MTYKVIYDVKSKLFYSILVWNSNSNSDFNFRQVFVIYNTEKE